MWRGRAGNATTGWCGQLQIQRPPGPDQASTRFGQRPSQPARQPFGTLAQMVGGCAMEPVAAIRVIGEQRYGPPLQLQRLAVFPRPRSLDRRAGQPLLAVSTHRGFCAVFSSLGSLVLTRDPAEPCLARSSSPPVLQRRAGLPGFIPYTWPCIVCGRQLAQL